MVFPSALNVPVITLPEIQRREVGRLPRERPHPVGQAHRVQAHHAAGVVVMLGVRAGLRVGADDHQAVGRLGHRDLGALDQELPVQRPFERAAPPYGAGASRRRANRASTTAGVADGRQSTPCRRIRHSVQSRRRCHLAVCTAARRFRRPADDETPPSLGRRLDRRPRRCIGAAAPRRAGRRVPGGGQHASPAAGLDDVPRAPRAPRAARRRPRAEPPASAAPYADALPPTARAGSMLYDSPQPQ